MLVVLFLVIGLLLLGLVSLLMRGRGVTGVLSSLM